MWRLGGLDTARTVDYTALAVGDVEDDARQGRKLFVNGVKQWPHEDYELILKDLRGIDFRKRFDRIAVDATGEVSFIERLEEYLPIERVRYSNESKWEMYSDASQLMSSKHVQIARGLTELWSQINEYQFHPSAGKYPRLDHPSGRHDDQLQAFLLLCHIAKPFIFGGSAPTLYVSGQDDPMSRRLGVFDELMDRSGKLRTGITLKSKTRRVHG